MVAAALADGTADRQCVFEVFARRLPDGRRYGVVAGHRAAAGVDLAGFRFGDGGARRRCAGVVDARHARLAGATTASPATSTATPRASCTSPAPRSSPCPARSPTPWCWRRWRCRSSTTTRAVASAAARMVTAAAGRPLIEMGSRRTHEAAAVAAARAAYLAGFSPRRTWRPSAATASRPPAPPRTPGSCCTTTSWRRSTRQVDRLGPNTTLLVDTYDIRRGIELAIEAAGPELGAIRIDSGDLGELARQAREQLDALGATDTRIVLSGDLDEYAIAALRAEPVDSYGVGHLGRHRLRRADGRHGLQARRGRRAAGGQAQRVEGVASAAASRRCAATSRPAPPSRRSCTPPARPVPVGPHDRVLPVPLVRGGDRCPTCRRWSSPASTCARALVSVPWEGLKLSRGEPALPTVLEGF